MTQNERLAEHLERHRSITPLQAWVELGIYRLAARINDLRNAGLQITKTLVVVRNQYGEDCRVAEYRLQAPK